jgi:hypothetical protein
MQQRVAIHSAAADGRRMLKLNKVDVARRQFATALELWFADGDAVAIHTLAMASQEVLSELAKHRRLKHLTTDFLNAVVSKAFSVTEKHVWQLMKAPANFFKHADEDPEAEIEFDPEWNWPVLSLCLMRLLYLVDNLTDLEAAFWVRLHLEQPELYKLPTELSHLPAAFMAHSRTASRPDFWASFKKKQAVGKHRATAG